MGAVRTGMTSFVLGDVEVHRLGYGAMRITGDGIWGPPPDRDARHDATTGQVALAWLLAHSPVLLPIPGTGSIEHLKENVAAGRLRLSDDERAELDAAAG